MGMKFGKEAGDGSREGARAKFHPHRCNVSLLWGEKKLKIGL